MDLSIILTAIGSVVSIIASNIALISWLRADMKLFETKIDGWKDEINNQMRDFHGRLCSIEARYHQQDMEKKNDCKL
jgi:hypothetical protein